MKLYETMRSGKNLGWCKCYISEDGNRAIVVNEGEIISEYGLVNVMCCEPEGLIETEELHECGCAECPYRDECEAMVM